MEKTISSVRNQSSRDFEYIVVDGGSKDGSKEAIYVNSDIIDKWVSEPDSGIYNAMNKGATMASGEYLTYLNSGDTLHDVNVIKDTIQWLSAAKREDIVFGKVLNVWGERSSVYCFDHELTLISLHYDVVNHSGAMIRRELQLKYPYREDLKICSDRQFFIEAIVFGNCTYGHLDRIITTFDKTGVSSSESSLKAIEEENEEILKSVLPPRIYVDYKRTNLMLSQMTSTMTPYYRLSKIMCKLNIAFIKFIQFLRKVK